MASPRIIQGLATISGQEARHIQRVLRLAVGDPITIFDGTGKEYNSRIARQDRHTVTVEVQETMTPVRESPLRIVMGQSLIKGDRMDFVVQKATEMGISQVTPFVSSRSIPRLEGHSLEQRLDRWRRIAVESSKQCGRVVPLRIDPPVPFDRVLDSAERDLKKLILWEGSTYSIKSLLREMDAPYQGILFLVGPEGGFSEDEVRQAERARFVAVGMGPRILRVETVGISFAGILQYEWGDMG